MTGLMALMTAAAWAVGTENVQPALVNDTSRVVDLDEVVVVPQPKEGFSLRQQCINSTAFTSNELNRLEIRNLSQLADYVPSFAMPQYGSRLTSSMYMRVIGSL